MINPQELRLGNLIHHTRNNINTGIIEDVPIVVDGNLIKELELRPYLGYNPIPLTPAILEAAGFNWSGGDHYEKGELWLEDYKGGYRIVRPHFCHRIFKYAHELQNGYFILYGQELEIKL